MDETTDLGLLRRDFTPALKDACELFARSADGAEPILKEGMEGRPALLDRNLLRMVVAERRLSRLVLPTPDAMEYFGLPRSITASALDPDPTVRVQDPARETWDFRPWLSEKITYLRDNLQALLETVEQMMENAEPRSEAPAAAPSEIEGQTLEERLRERALYELRASRSYAREILAAIDTMGLSVVDWRLTG